MGDVEKKGIIEDAVHNESHGRYRNPDNAPIPTGAKGIKKKLLPFQEARIMQSTLQPRKPVQNGNEAGLLIEQ